MNTEGWSEEQLNGLRTVKRSLSIGLGVLAVEAGVFILDITDKIDVPLLGHLLLGAWGGGIAGSNLLYLRDLHRNPPVPQGIPEQI